MRHMQSRLYQHQQVSQQEHGGTAAVDHTRVEHSVLIVSLSLVDCLSSLLFRSTHSRPVSSCPGVGQVLPAEDRFPELLEDYKTYAEQQIQALCTEITQLMENSVVKTTTKVESKVFFSKLCGDYYRYCRSAPTNRREQEASNAWA
jgi:hypothetical protein